MQDPLRYKLPPSITNVFRSNCSLTVSNIVFSLLMLVIKQGYSIKRSIRRVISIFNIGTIVMTFLSVESE